MLDEMIVHCIAMCIIMEWLDDVVTEYIENGTNPEQFCPNVSSNDPFSELLNSPTFNAGTSIEAYTIDMYMQYVKGSLHPYTNFNSLCTSINEPSTPLV